MVTTFILPSIGDLNFSKLNDNNTHACLDNTKMFHNTGINEKYVRSNDDFAKRLNLM